MIRSTLFAAIACATFACASGGGPEPAAMQPVAGEEKSLDGLHYVDVTPGSGAAAARLQCVYVHYTGWRANGRQFETSRGGDPVSFVLGVGTVMPGWDIGIAGMKVGGQRRLMIPARLAYGDKGKAPSIPGGASLVFDTELMAVTDAPGGRACPAWKDVR